MKASANFFTDALLMQFISLCHHSRRLILSLTLLPTAAQAQTFTSSSEFVAENFCPFECCSYGTWKTKQAVRIYSEKRLNSKVLGTIPAKTSVNSLSGDVHLMPVKLEMLQDHGQYTKGDTLWILNYIGEGEYRMWKDGKFDSIMLPFSPYDETQSISWGRLTGSFEFTWWVKIRDSDGLAGWTHDIDSFSGKDACRSK